MLRTAIVALLAGTSLVAAGPAGAENGVTRDTVLLGQSVALTGPAAELGIQMRNGAKVYFDHVNALGGVHGRRIELRTLDDGYEPSRTVPNTKRLIEEDRVFALFGYVGTPTSAAALPIFTQAKVPYFGPFTGAELLRQPFNRYVFNVRASYYDETEKIVEQVVSIGGKNIAVFYQDDAYGLAGLKGVELAMNRRGMKVSALGTVKRNTVDVEEAVKSIHAAKPDAVVMISAYKSCAQFIRQMKKAGSGATFYNVSFVGSQALADELGPDGVGVAISQVMPFPWGASVPVVREYQELMAKAGHKDFNFTAIEGFIAAKVFVDGLRRTGRNLTRERFIATMEGMEDVDIGGFYVGFSPRNHSASRFVDLTIIGREGRFLR